MGLALYRILRLRSNDFDWGYVMRKLGLRRPSPAMAVALLALFVALAGSATAASLIKGSDIAPNAITSSKVKNHSLKSRDFRAGALPRGLRGFTGAPGSPGKPGSPGTPGKPGPTVLHTYANQFDNPDGEQSFGFADCAAGEYATGGGVVTDSETVGEQSVNSSVPDFSSDDALAPDSWTAYVDNSSPDGTNDPALTFTVVVTCAPATDVGVFAKRALMKK
jgi:hypothetical protein